MQYDINNSDGDTKSGKVLINNLLIQKIIRLLDSYCTNFKFENRK